MHRRHLSLRDFAHQVSMPSERIDGSVATLRALRQPSTTIRHGRQGGSRGGFMFLGVPLDQLAWLAAAVFVAGILTGIFAGLFGIGGGAVIVPVLFEAFRILGVPEEVRMQLCVGTSLAIIIPTTVRSYRTHRAKGLTIPLIMKSWAWPAVVGVGVGSVAAAFAPAALFKAAFVLIASVIAAKLLAG